jgi:hypothetical protein
LKKPPKIIANQPAKDTITSCNAKAIPAPATPKATVNPPSLSLYTMEIRIIVRIKPIKPLSFLAL